VYKIKGSLILVVDHSHLFRTMLRQFLEEKGYVVCTASTAKEAVDEFAREEPAMVLMGAVMSDKDGDMSSLDACRRMRAMDTDEYCPILMITSTEDEALVADAFEAGASDFILKPIQWVLLEHSIKFKLQASKAAYAVEASEKRFRQLFDHSPLPYQAMDEKGNIVDANDAWFDMMGMEKDEVRGKSFGDMMDACEWKKFMHMIPSFVKTGVLSNMQLSIFDNHGSPLIIELNGRVAYDIRGRFRQAHCVLQNITERKVMEDELRHLATSDPLTGLSNRRSFFAEGEQARLQCIRYGHPLTVMMLDIDHFKSINDRFGHDVGDQVLKLVSHEMKQQIRDVDILGRLGGEEFAIALPETDLATAIKVAERIRVAVESFTLEVEQGSVTFTISIGVAEITDAKESSQELIKQADNLLYQAKENGRNRIETALL